LVAFWVRRFRRFGRFGRFRRCGRLGGLRLGLEIILLPIIGKIFRLSNVNDTQKIVNIFSLVVEMLHKSNFSDLQ